MKQAIDIRIVLVDRFVQVLNAFGDAIAIAVDMPIGLFEAGKARARPCDAIARVRLGSRASTIFFPPTRAMLDASSYELLRSEGLSVQSYNLIPRIRELDGLITAELQQTVWESHPELSFSRMVGTPITYPKRTPEGRAARRAALYQAFGSNSSVILDQLYEQSGRLPRAAVKEDDVLDACALSWSAWQHALHNAEICIGEPRCDLRGLLMAIRF